MGFKQTRMMKNIIKTDHTKRYQFKPIKSYSVEEVLAGGGTSAFAYKMGKSPQNLVEALKDLPKESFLTNQEFDKALQILQEEK
jgi:hypothetical protein